MNVRLLSLPAVALLWLVCAATAASAQWCGRMQGGESCGFATLSQCRATTSGVGGGCYPNPRAAAYGAAPGVAAARRARIEQGKSWRKALQERRRARQKEMARERQRSVAPIATRRSAPPAAAIAGSGPAAGIPVAELDVNAVPNLSREGIRRVQTVLKEKGFDPGPLNGVPSPRLAAAVRTFQGLYGIVARGEIDNQTLLALGEADLASQSNR